MENKQKLLSDLNKAKAVFQLRAVTAAMGIEMETDCSEPGMQEIKIRDTWNDCSWREACEIFDAEGIPIKEIRRILGHVAEGFYINWIYENVK